MLVACRMAGLSALGGPCGAQRAPATSPCGGAEPWGDQPNRDPMHAPSVLRPYCDSGFSHDGATTGAGDIKSAISASVRRGRLRPTRCRRRPG